MRTALWTTGVPAFEPSYGQKPPSLRLFPVSGAGWTVLVVPGGGYTHKAPHEAEPIARMFNRLHIGAAVLDYRVAPYRAPVPQTDLCRAVRVLRRLSGPDGRIAVLGFSAGGHLAASAAYLEELPSIEGPDDALAGLSPRPDAVILCYPVITMGSMTHPGSRDSLLGPSGADAADAWSVERHVRAGGPPAFIWHTADDGAVPVENSLLLAGALSEKHIPFELHIFPHGPHGLGLAKKFADISTWPLLAADWLGRL